MIDLYGGGHGGALILTTARERMRRRAAGDEEGGLEAVVEDNLAEERYSLEAEVGGLAEVAYAGVTLRLVKAAAGAKRALRRALYGAEKRGQRVNNFENQYSQHSYRFKNIKIYNLNQPISFDRSIDQVVKCYCVFDKDVQSDNLESERQRFYTSIVSEINDLLEEFFQVVHQYPHKLLVETLDYLEQTARKLTTDALNTFENISELCTNCGTNCESKADLMMHIETKSCNKSFSHRCQCMQVFDSHMEWIKHWLKTDMSCSTIAWHLWKNLYRNNNNTQVMYKCDGCQKHYVYFMKFWNHICYCSFFQVFLLANCQFCSEFNKSNTYGDISFQESIQMPHSDKVGIKILKEWSQIPTICFKVRLTVPDDQELLKSLIIQKDKVE